MGGEWDRKLSGLLLLLSLSSMLLPASCIDLDEAQPFSLAKQMQLCVRERETHTVRRFGIAYFFSWEEQSSQPQGSFAPQRRTEG